MVADVKTKVESNSFNANEQKNKVFGHPAQSYGALISLSDYEPSNLQYTTFHSYIVT